MQDADIPQDWQALLAEFHRRRDAGHAMGGEEKLARRRASGKLNAREVIAQLQTATAFTSSAVWSAA